VYASAQEGLIELEKDTEKRLKYIEFIDCYANLKEKDYQEYREEYLPESTYKEEIMGLLQMERKEGFYEGEMAILRRLILRRFGSFPSWVSDRLKKIDIKDLEILTDRILDAKSVEEVFGIQVLDKRS